MPPRKRTPKDGPTEEQLELMRAFEALKHRDGKPPAPTALGEHLGKSRHTVGMMLRTLTDLGWYEPPPAERDLTRAGRKWVRK
jgi:hypothetical protein